MAGLKVEITIEINNNPFYHLYLINGKRVYIDTSVAGGRFDKEFSVNTIPFFDSVSVGEIVIMVSDLLEAELLRAPQQVKDFLKAISSIFIDRLR